MHDDPWNNSHMNEAADQAEAALDALVPRLRQFAVVAREEHLTRAAELLGVPQPTLSRSIARLEADLGVPLFTRPGRSIRLTRHGRALLDAAERTMATLSGTVERLAAEAHPGHGRVALGFLHTVRPCAGTSSPLRPAGDHRRAVPRAGFSRDDLRGRRPTRRGLAARPAGCSAPRRPSPTPRSWRSDHHAEGCPHHRHRLAWRPSADRARCRVPRLRPDLRGPAAALT